jgi:hypothetical protein
VDLALVADALTLVRGLLGVLLAYLIVRGRMDAVAVWLSVGWVTDFLDGRVARAAAGHTRLGRWDFPADVILGGGVLVGLAAAGLMPPIVTVLVLAACGGGYLLLRNAALGMILQAVAWVAILWQLWIRRAPAAWLPVAVAATIGVVNRRKLIDDEIPAFIRGVSRAVRLHRGSSLGLDDQDEDG